MSSFFRLFVGSIVVLFTLLPRCALASNGPQGFQPVSPEELAMKSEPLAPGAPAIILFRQVDRDDKRGARQYNYFRVKILTEEGRKYADIEIPFLDRRSDITGINARTIRPDGSIANFEGKIFQKTVVKAKGFKFLAKTFTLPDVQVGSVIEYYYTTVYSGEYVFDSEWVISDELFTRHAQFSLKPYQSDYNSFSIRWSWQRLPPGTGEPKQGSDHIVRLDVSNVPAFQVEDFMPPQGEVESRVDFVYSDGPFELDQGKFWQKTGKKLNDQLENFIGKRNEMQQAVAQIVSPGDSQEVKLQKVYDRVQQLRNTSYEIRKTEQEEKRDKEKYANNVADVWKRGYGDGQQLTWLYLALVRAAGFEAYGVWTASRNKYFFNPSSMNDARLNANLVVVVLDGKSRFFDPGAAFAPFGLLPWQETGVTGLCLNKDGGSWMKIPAQESSASRVERSAHFKLSDTGDLEGKLSVTYTGLEAMQRRVEERHEDEVERRKYLEDEVKSLVPAAIEIELTNQPAWNSSTVPLVAEFQMKVPGWVSGAAHRVLMPVGFFSASEKRVFEHANRVHPIYMEYLFQKVDDVTIELPAGWKPDNLPDVKNQGGNVISFEMKFDSSENKLHMRRKIEVDFLMLDTQYYAALRKFYQTLGSSDDEQVVLQTATATAKK